MLFLAAAAFAGGIHAGIPVRGVPGLGEPSFVSPETGWTAPVEAGFVRVYVGPTEAEAEGWLAHARMTLSLPAAEAPLTLGDAAFGDGDALYAFRDGNVAVMVRAERDALGIARRLQAAIEDGPAWPPAPTPTVSGGRWTFAVDDAAHVAFTGGRAVPYVRGVYDAPPREVVVWDRYGRPSVWRP